MCRWTFASFNSSRGDFSTIQSHPTLSFLSLFKLSSQSAVTAHSFTSVSSIPGQRSQSAKEQQPWSSQCMLKDISAKWMSATPGHLMNDDLYTALMLRVVLLLNNWPQWVHNHFSQLGHAIRNSDHELVKGKYAILVKDSWCWVSFLGRQILML